MSRPKKNVLEEEPEQKVSTEENSGTSGTKEELIIVAPPSQKQLSKEKLNKFIAEETKLVKGRFKCYEHPGGDVKIIVRKYPGIQPFDKVMIDNEIYEIPLYVARHLNGLDVTSGSGNPRINTCAWPTHGYKWAGKDGEGKGRQDGDGIAVPILGVAKWNRRYGFESLEFDTGM
jgi:hypothetical protein